MWRALSTAFIGCGTASLPMACNAENKGDVPPKVGTTRHANTTVAANGNNEFAFDLYKELAKERSNLFFSPYSISNALAVTFAGAKGETAAEIAGVLHAGANKEDFHRSFAELSISVRAAERKERVELISANAFWQQVDLLLDPGFVEQTERDYGVEFKKADFQSSAEGARASINEWTAAKTKGKIQQVLGPGSVDGTTRFILINAVYFNAKWASAFPKSETKDESFLAGFSDSVRVPMMKVTLVTGYHSEAGVQAVRLSYVDGRLSFYAFLPETEAALRQFEKRLGHAAINDISGRMKEHVVDLSMPRFRVESEIPLKQPLARLGIVSLFAPKADLSGMAASSAKLSVGNVVHKTYLNVDEQGTEAAAATAVVGVKSISAQQPMQRVQMNLDRPFVFLVRDNESGAVLFVGRLVCP